MSPFFTDGAALATMVLAVIAVGGVMTGLVAWLVRRFIREETEALHRTQKDTLHQVRNSHSTNLRDDIDQVLKEQRAMRDDLQSHLSWHQIDNQRHNHRTGDGL